MAETLLSTRPRGFKIGDHPVSRSLFGLKKSQVAGAGASVAAGFLALLSSRTTGGVVAMIAIAGAGCALFLIGYKRRTLDAVLAAAIGSIGTLGSQRGAHYSYSLLGETSLTEAPSHLIIPRNDGSVRISPIIRSMKRKGRSGMRSSVEESSAGGRNFGLVIERKESVIAFELFGENFLYKNREDQNSHAAGFGHAIGAIPSMSDCITSVSLVFTVELGSQRVGRDEISSEWEDEVKDLYAEAISRQITRRSFLVIRSHGLKPSAALCETISTTIEANRIKCLLLDGKSLGSLLTFGTGAPSGSRALKMKSCWNEILFDNKLAKLFDVAELPKGEVRPDFLVPFLGGLRNSALLSFQFRQIDSRYALRKVRTKRSQITADAGLRALFGFLARTSEAKAIENLEVQESELDMGYEMFSVAAIFALFAPDRSRLALATSEVTALAEKNGLVLECAYGRQIHSWRKLFGGGG